MPVIFALLQLSIRRHTRRPQRDVEAKNAQAGARARHVCRRRADIAPIRGSGKQGCHAFHAMPCRDITFEELAIVSRIYQPSLSAAFAASPLIRRRPMFRHFAFFFTFHVSSASRRLRFPAIITLPRRFSLSTFTTFSC
jgi:hypothetical protein